MPVNHLTSKLAHAEPYNDRCNKKTTTYIVTDTDWFIVDKSCFTQSTPKHYIAARKQREWRVTKA